MESDTQRMVRDTHYESVSEIELYKIPYAVVEALSRQVFRQLVSCVVVAVVVCGSVGKLVGQC